MVVGWDRLLTAGLRFWLLQQRLANPWPWGEVLGRNIYRIGKRLILDMTKGKKVNDFSFGIRGSLLWLANVSFTLSIARFKGILVKRDFTWDGASSWYSLICAFLILKASQFIKQGLDFSVSGLRMRTRYLESSYVSDKQNETVGLSGILS